MTRAGRPTLFIGLSLLNRQKLNNDEQIVADGRDLHLPMTVVLCGGPSHEAIIASMRATGRISLNAVVGGDPDQPSIGPMRVTALAKSGSPLMMILLSTPQLARIGGGGFYVVHGDDITEPVDMSAYHVLIASAPADSPTPAHAAAVYQHYGDPRDEPGWRFHPHQHPEHTAHGRQLLDLLDGDGKVSGYALREPDGSQRRTTLRTGMCLCQPKV